MAKIQTGSQEAAYALYLRTLADELEKRKMGNLLDWTMLREVADYLEDLLE